MAAAVGEKFSVDVWIVESCELRSIMAAASKRTATRGREEGTEEKNVHEARELREATQNGNGKIIIIIQKLSEKDFQFFHIAHFASMTSSLSLSLSLFALFLPSLAQSPSLHVQGTHSELQIKMEKTHSSRPSLSLALSLKLLVFTTAVYF